MNKSHDRKQYKFVYKILKYDELHISKKRQKLSIKQKVFKEISYVETAKKILNENKNLRIFAWDDFEKLIAELLLNDGWNVYHTRFGKDGGVDIIATRNLEKIGYFKVIWQVKKYSASNSVGIDVVRQFGYLVMKTGASKGIIVTTGKFTRGALKLVKENEYTLSCVGYDDIERWIVGKDNQNDMVDILDDLPF